MGTHMQLGDVNAAIEEERKIKNEVLEAYGLTERKVNAMSGELEESKALLEAAIRGQRQVEQELIDTREQVTDVSASNNSLGNAKRKLENDIHQMQADLDNMLASCKNSEEKAKKAMVDAGRLADELRSEQDHPAHRRGAQDHHQGRAPREGAAVPAGGEQEEPGQDHRHQPGQVQEGPAGLRGGRGEVQDLRSQHHQVQERPWCLHDSWTHVKPFQPLPYLDEEKGILPEVE